MFLMSRAYIYRWRVEADREDVCSDGPTVTFNHLQQGPCDDTERPWTPVECCPTTDPWGITDGAFGGQ